jgi:thioredoxin-related protein
MKNSLYIIIFLLASFKIVAQDDVKKINWLSLNEALALQKETPKKIIMDVYADWCGPCKMLDKHTFTNADVVDYVNENYYAVKFNGEGNEEVTFDEKTFNNPDYDPAKSNRRNSPHQFAVYMGLNAYPTMVFFDEEARMITPVKGYQTPQQLELYLKLFKSDAYKEMTSQEKFNEYYEAFKPTFKEE